MRWTACFWLVTALCAAGCGKDYQNIGDQHVEKDILAHQDKREALAFFEAKGHLFDVDGRTNVDREIIVPMLKQLKTIADTEQWAIVNADAPNSAAALLVKLPDDMPTVDEMAEAVQQADDKFSGFILQQWGHEWLLMNLIPQEAYEFLKKSNPDIDKQR